MATLATDLPCSALVRRDLHPLGWIKRFHFLIVCSPSSELFPTRQRPARRSPCASCTRRARLRFATCCASSVSATRQEAADRCLSPPCRSACRGPSQRI